MRQLIDAEDILGAAQEKGWDESLVEDLFEEFGLTDWACENKISVSQWQIDAPPITAASICPSCRARTPCPNARIAEAQAASNDMAGPSRFNPSETSAAA